LIDEDDDVLIFLHQVLTYSMTILTCSLFVNLIHVQFEAIITMSYKAGVITAITGLKDRTGSSSIAIKKSM
jgi:hypothetical protein